MNNLKTLLVAANQQNSKATTENCQLQRVLEAQRTIISDISNSLMDDKDIQEQIEINRQMEENLDSSIESSSAYLNSLLCSPSDSKKKLCETSDILKNIITDIQGQFIELCKQCINQGMISVPITAVVDVEQQLNLFEDKLEDNGQFPESEEKKNQRILIRNFHFQKIMSFLGESLHKKSDSEDDDEYNSIKNENNVDDHQNE